MIDEEDSEDWKLEVMHGVNAGVHASVSLGLVFFQSKARVWVDCSVPAAWKTAMIALQSKARSWVDCSVPAAWKTTKIASPCEARGWVVCAVYCAWCSLCTMFIYLEFATHKWERPYQHDSTASRLLSEVKHARAQLVLRWGTTLES